MVGVTLMPNMFFDANGNYYETITDVPVPPGHTVAAERPAPVEKTASEIEADVRAVADRLTQNSERDMVMALATVDLVIAARDGQLNGLNRQQVARVYRDRVVGILRKERGLSDDGEGRNRAR